MAINYSFVATLLLSGSLLLTACTDKNATSMNESQPPEAITDPLTQEVNEKNEKLNLKALQLTTYAQEVGASLQAPVHQEFSANGTVEIKGTVEKHEELKSNYVWIKINAKKEHPLGQQMDYYTPIKNGEFTQTISLFNGEDEYEVIVQLPDSKQDNYYYDIACFTVHNVNPEIQRDVTLTTFGQDAGLKLDYASSYVKAAEQISFSGIVDSPEIMIRLKKDADTWKHIVPVKNGEFSMMVPLFYGRGLHELEILVPDKERENYYQPATTILIENDSDRVMQPLEFYRAYDERGVTLLQPTFGGDEAEGTYPVKGYFNPSAEFAKETTHIYVSTKKGEDEALDVIPVENMTFDGSFYLRFGSGTYEVTLSVPEITEENSDRFRFYGFATFDVTSNAEDQRDLLPSRGVQSDAPEIISLAQDLTAEKSSTRDKTLAIFEYVAKNITYDVKKYKNNEFRWDDSALKTLERKTGVCQDYAYLTIALLRASGIEARYVEGRAGSPWPGNHAWVEANIDGEWVEMDPTWGSGYLDREDRFVPAYNVDYFDPDPDEFGKTHTRTGVQY